MTTITLVLIIVSSVGSVINALAAAVPPTTTFGKVLHVAAALLPLDFQRTVQVLQTPPSPASVQAARETLH